MKFVIILVGIISAASAHYRFSGFGKRPVTFPNDSNNFFMDTTREPVVILENVVLSPMNILFISDTASLDGIGKAFEKDYAELYGFIGRAGLRPGKPMSFYLTNQDPISMEVAVEVDNLPGTVTGRIRSKKTLGGNAVVVHYTGPYEEMARPYNAITQWIKENNKQVKGLPFEVYLNDPGSVKDKYELRTDVYQLFE